jgi:hypothetical protein
MKKFVAVSLVFVLTLFLGMVGSALAGGICSDGNYGIGCLAANTVYRVNIIAYENCPKQDNAQRIAVLADFTPDGYVDTDKKNKIYLVPGDDFRVLDSNACEDETGDTEGAVLQLPTGTDLTQTYSVWVRLVGPPWSGINVKTCAYDPGLDAIVCGETFSKVRYTGKGEPHFTNATNQLLTVNGTPLFDTSLEDYFWNWGATGRPHAQVWFATDMD